MERSEQTTHTSPHAVAEEIIQKIALCEDLKTLQDVRVSALGKNGVLTQLLKSIVNVPVQDRKAYGQSIHQAKSTVEAALNARQSILDAKAIDQSIARESIDITLPGTLASVGHVHPVTQVIQTLSDIFASLGFTSVYGPEMEDDFHNFTALNIGQYHPARAMHDTFYINENHLLRTHTSPAQIHVMLEEEPPIRVMSMGKVYRCDSDPTHSPMFHQLEGLVVSEQASFVELKALLDHFFSTFFGRTVDMRFRPSYFPFTEPSAEVDIRMSKHAPWLEVMGCGMVHPNVFSQVNIDSAHFKGYAFGMGIDRLAMLKYGIDDLRMLFDNDIAFLEQF